MSPYHFDPRRLAIVAAMGMARLAATEPAPEAKDVTTSLLATAEAWRNVRGGTATAGWWNTFVTASIELNGARLGAPRTSAVVGQVHWVSNRRDDATFTDATGAFTPVSGLMANTHFRVFNLHYRQTAGDGRWTFKIGQLAIDDDFMLSEYTALFANAAFGSLLTQVATPLASAYGGGAAQPIYPLAAPGVWLQVQLSEAVSWQSGVYHGGPGEDLRDNHGFSWDQFGSSGVVVFSEASWRQTVLGRSTLTRVGVTGHTGPMENYRASEAGGTDVRVHGLYSAYLVQDVTVVADHAGRPKVGVFTRVGLSPQHERSAVTFYADAGANWFGPLATRPDDVVGIAFTRTHFSPGFRTLNGLASNEGAVELAYRCQITKRLEVQTDVQWLYGATTDTRRHGSATIIGLRSSFTF